MTCPRHSPLFIKHGFLILHHHKTSYVSNRINASWRRNFLQKGLGVTLVKMPFRIETSTYRDVVTFKMLTKKSVCRNIMNFAQAYGTCKQGRCIILNKVDFPCLTTICICKRNITHPRLSLFLWLGEEQVLTSWLFQYDNSLTKLLYHCCGSST